MRDGMWMATTSTSAIGAAQHATVSAKPSREIVLEAAANELIVAVVGHVGSGTSEIAEALHNLLEEADQPGGPYEAEVLKARNEIEQWATDAGEALPKSDRNDLETTKSLQDLGDKMRVASNDASAVARALVKRIRFTRAEKIGSELQAGVAIAPDGKRRAYILDAIRNPAEVDLLRHVYQDAFVLIGVVCDEKVRLQRIMEKYKNAGRTDGEDLMKRDAKATSRFG